MDTIDKFLKTNCLSNHPGGENLLGRLKFLELLELREIKERGIWGFDGFHLKDGGIQIDQAYSANYSGLTKLESIQRAFEFIDAHTENDIAYEVVVR